MAYFKNYFLKFKFCCSSAFLSAQVYIPPIVLLLLFGGEATCSGTESCSDVVKWLSKESL